MSDFEVRVMQARQKLVIFDDDVCFGALLTAKARQAGFDTKFFTSLIDLGSFARIKEFDIAIIDYFLGSIRGDEIAEYVDTFFAEIPVIIVSSNDFDPRQVAKWPASVRQFVPKTQGIGKIIDAARGVLERDRMLRHFLAPPPPWHITSLEA